jgi:predicted phage terminase large subunit-like protein
VTAPARSFSPLSPVTLAELQASLPRWQAEHRQKVKLTTDRSEGKPGYCPQAPTGKQAEFLSLTCLEAFYGGAARGGKSSALLIGALQYAHVPGYSALILRRSFADLALPDAIMARAKQWLMGQPGVTWNDDTKTFRFKSGATLTFGYLATEVDKYRYQSAQFQYIAFDELTHFTETQYTYLFSRLSRLEGSQVPLRMRSASNPGGVGHRWVFERFVDPEKEHKATFIPARLEDNPHVDQAAYREALSELDPVTRSQLEDGNWDDIEPGDFFDQSNFVLIDEPPARLDGQARYWDFASTEPKKGKDPDATASCRMGFVNVPGNAAIGINASRVYYVLDATEDWWSAGEVPGRVGLQAREDGLTVPVRWEMEGGSSGAIASERAFKPELVGYDCDGIRSTGSKGERAKPYAARVAHRKVFVLKRPWTKKWLDQHHRFPAVEHDDSVDAASGAFNFLETMAVGQAKPMRMGAGITGTLNTDKSGRRVRVFG